ncbi:hypothetical protein [Flavobacterium okayamense]|uniref:Translation elongation factor EFTu/EF1A C-terminal domain-containing protein n=1 Tax=Flavobacterium okayamense TaxID=2830782 RepID=A0ABN6HYJ8_9FLAO|nr:hypothetical protein [Flavobacterium okayamense]BCY29332.1 hypothetical protein KK2020170_22000 [Flavobacterium okayamense]
MDFIAELKYKTSEDGGRKTPAFSGYRPQLKFVFTDLQSSGSQFFIDKNIVKPGETVIAQIKITSPQFYTNQLETEMEFEFREGEIIIGTGKIIEIINKTLEK